MALNIIRAVDKVSVWLDRFAAALAKGDIDAAAGLFEPEGFWRDLVAFTWNIRTCEGRAEIKAMLAATLAATKPAAWRIAGAPRMANGATEAWLGFETALGRGIGHVRLRDGRCWTLLTTLQELKGFEEKAGATRPSGVVHGAQGGRRSWLEERRAEQESLGVSRQPYVLIVGGGQGGIALGARLKRLGVPALIVEKNGRAGDSWRKRYASLCLHDPVWYDHMPYLPFPDHWPVFSPKDKIADWLEMYVKVMELDYWTNARVLKGSYLEDSWEVKILKDEKEVTLKPTHLVLATGMSGFPSIPKIPGAETFEGKLAHSSAFAGGAGWQGRKCVVVGASTSAHDICADLWEHGAEPTMVQRSSTIVATSEALTEFAWGRLYSEQALQAGITTEIADLTVASVPFKVLPGMQKEMYEKILARDRALYDGLTQAGFLHDMGEDGSGIHAAYLRRGAGYYIEVGASRMIIEGKIRLESPASVESLGRASVRLSNGRELPADLVVFATGYGSMNGWAAELISPEVAERVGKCWGLGSQTKYDPGPWVGELRNMWKPTRQPGLWFHGGNLMQSRHYSLYLALQLKARLEGLPAPVYFVDPVHHVR
jgi:putative flavoprotein involved in K+ transport